VRSRTTDDRHGLRAATLDDSLAFHLVLVPGKRKREKMAVMTSVGRDEMGASVDDVTSSHSTLA
jgi:hypothetical protein